MFLLPTVQKIEEISRKDLEELEEVLEKVAEEKLDKKVETEELRELEKDVEAYKVVSTKLSSLQEKSLKLCDLLKEVHLCMDLVWRVSSLLICICSLVKNISFSLQNLNQIKEVVESGTAKEELKESKAAKRLSKRVDSMVQQLQEHVHKLHEEKATLQVYANYLNSCSFRAFHSRSLFQQFRGLGEEQPDCRVGDWREI